MSARDELAEALEDVIEGGDDSNYDDMASALMIRGYEKPRIIGYIVVGRDGKLIRPFGDDQATAQAFAEEWTADCKTAGIDWDYRVATITELDL